LAALQSRVLDAWGEFSILAKRYAGATPDERRSLREEFYEVSVRMLANAEAIRSLLVHYHQPEGTE
jgi:hypothetical protein